MASKMLSVLVTADVWLRISLFKFTVLSVEQFLHVNEKYHFVRMYFLQCFDAVGWAAGRASGL